MQENHITANLEDYRRVVEQPIEYLTLSLEDNKNGGRNSALILTEEDILNIKRYEKKGLSLPITLKQVEESLGFKSSNITGLEPDDMLKVYQDINQHARTWVNIETQIKNTGGDIDRFSTSFTSMGDQIIRTIEKMDLVKQINLTIGDTSIEDIEYLNPTPLNDDDQRIVTLLSDILRNAANDIDGYRQKAQALVDTITSFSKTLAEQLIPAVNHRAALASRSNLNQQITELENDIAQLTINIDQKNKEYSKSIQNAALGIFGGPVGLAITGGIFGSRAEEIRKFKNRLVSEKNTKVQELATKVPLSGAIRDLQLSFEDLVIRMEDAQQSSANLRDMWVMMAAYVNNSADALANITNDKDLLSFTFEFNNVVNPWRSIKSITLELLNLFERALVQYRLEQNR